MSQARSRVEAYARCLAAVGVAVALAGLGRAVLARAAGEAANTPPGPKAAPKISETVLRERCSACHLFPEPKMEPRWAWASNVRDMYRLLDLSEELPPDQVIAWFEKRAPERFPLYTKGAHLDAGRLRTRVRSFSPAGAFRAHAVSNVHLVDLVDDARLELVVCDMINGLVLLGYPYREDTTLQVIAQVPHPAHAEVLDLDRDGRRDLLVADLGTAAPGDDTRGSIVWLRGTGGVSFQKYILQEGLGRVADVEAGDFDGDGDLDLVVAEFGWRKVGSVFLLENRTKDWDHPVFVRHPIDARTGSIHVPVADLDGDKRPDFLALISQENETIAAYVNRGDLQFETREIYRASTPSWGYSGLALVDLDKDGDLDLLATNGDSFDFSGPKPYHGIQWIENRGGLRFQPHESWPMMGAMRAEAGDLDGDGDLDIVACAMIGTPAAERDHEMLLESLLWLEQKGPGSFERHALVLNACDHATLSLGDYDKDGDLDFAVGVFNWPGTPKPRPEWVFLYENLLH